MGKREVSVEREREIDEMRDSRVRDWEGRSVRSFCERKECAVVLTVETIAIRFWGFGRFRLWDFFAFRFLPPMLLLLRDVLPAAMPVELLLNAVTRSADQGRV